LYVIKQLTNNNQNWSQICWLLKSLISATDLGSVTLDISGTMHPRGKRSPTDPWSLISAQYVIASAMTRSRDLGSVV